MPIIAPYQQDSLEMKPLNHVMVAMCLTPPVPGCNETEEDGEENAESLSSQDSHCQENVNQLNTDCTEGIPEFEEVGKTWLASKWLLFTSRCPKTSDQNQV